MSNLGMMILHDMFNKREDVWCERLFSPWTDLDKIMREQHIPLFALESQEPVKDFDFLGITMGYEMCYTNVLQLLDLSGIPLKAADRTEEDPIVIGGRPPAPIIRSQWRLSSILSISGREKPPTTLCSMPIGQQGGRRHKGDFLLAAARSPEFMCRRSMMFPIMRTEPLPLSRPDAREFRKKVEKQLVLDMEDGYDRLESLWCLLSRPLRTE